MGWGQHSWQAWEKSLFPMVSHATSLTLTQLSGMGLCVSPAMGCFTLVRMLNERQCRFKQAGLVRLRLLVTDWERFRICCVWEQELSVGSGAVSCAAHRDYPNPRQAFGCAPCTWVEQQLDDGGKSQTIEPIQCRPVPEQERGWKDRKQLPGRLFSECNVPPSLLCGRLTKVLLS